MSEKMGGVCGRGPMSSDTLEGEDVCGAGDGMGEEEGGVWGAGDGM